MSNLSFSEFTLLDEPNAAPEPTTVAEPTATGRALAKVDLLATALSRFGDWRPEVKRLVDKYKNVVFNVATRAGMAEARAALAEVRQPRFTAQNTSEASKSELAKVSKAVGAEKQAITDALAATEEHIEAQIQAEVKRQEAIEAKRKADDDARRLVHTDNLARLTGYVTSAVGKSADQLGRAVAFIEAFDVSGYEEFTAEA